MGVNLEPIPGYWLKPVTGSRVVGYWKLATNSSNQVAG
jgi:hypothetical protein